MMKVNYMTDRALETLRGNMEDVSRQLATHSGNSSWLPAWFKAHSVEPGEIYAEQEFEFDSIEFVPPMGPQDRKAESINSVRIYEALRKLPRYVLTNEKFWIWFNFEVGYRVALRMMPITLDAIGQKGKRGSSVFKDHWLFTEGTRRGIFFGVLSRCFFRVDLSYDETAEDPYHLTKFVLQNPLRLRSITWRSFSNDPTIARSILKAEQRIATKYPGYRENEQDFAKLTKEISMLGSVKLVDCMDEAAVEEYVYQHYESIVNTKLKK
jgi:hypothetical protein